MMVNNPYAKYKEQSTSTASKEELTLMLYDGALKFCNQAIVAAEGNQVEKTHNLIIRVQDIIEEFQITLDRKYEVSKDFDVMYEYIHRRLIEANTKKDPAILEEIKELLREFRDTWKEAMTIAKRR